MKRVIAICLMLSLSSCAGMGSKDSNSKLSEGQQNSSGFDEAYMARVEYQASRHGVNIKWINPPKAPKPKKDG